MLRLLLPLAVAVFPQQPNAQSSDTLLPVFSALKRALHAGANRDGALNRFWQEIGESGAPIVTAADAAGFARVTFIWRGDTTTHNVLLVSPLALQTLEGSALRQLETTDVWYLQLRLPSDAVWSYRFSVNDNGVPFERDTALGRRMQAMRPDPLNPQQFDYGPGGVSSLLVLRDAPRDWSAGPDPADPGRLDSLEVVGNAVGSRRVWIYTPPHYATGGEPYPALLVSDGASYLRLIHLPQILDRLIAAGRIRPLVAIFVDSPPAGRAADLSCSPDWSRFLVQSVLARLRTRYRIGTIAVGGYSLGGLAAACAAMAYPDELTAVIAQSGSFYRGLGESQPEAVARRLAAGARGPTRWYVEIGALETAAIPSRDPSMLTASRHLRDVLRARGYSVDYREFAGGHDFAAWRRTVALALQSIFVTGRGGSH